MDQKRGNMRSRVWRWGLALVLVSLAAGLPWGGWRLWRAWRQRTAMTESRELIQAGRHGVAARKLAEVLAREPDSDEAAYLLGTCEKSLGRPDRAAEVWARVPVTARFGVLSVLGRAALLVDGGRLADAERLIDQALSEPRIDGFDLRRFLTPLLWHEGRIREARRLVETNWESLNRAGRGGSD